MFSMMINIYICTWDLEVALEIKFEQKSSTTQSIKHASPENVSLMGFYKH